MANSAWPVDDAPPPVADLPEPEPDAPRAVDIHFGAQPGWGAHREGATIDLYRTPGGDLVVLGRDDSPDGLELVAAKVCALCHDQVSMLPERVVCGACGRCSTDGIAAVILKAHPAPDTDTKGERKAWDQLPESLRYPRPGRYVDQRSVGPGKVKSREFAGSDPYLYRAPA